VGERRKRRIAIERASLQRILRPVGDEIGTGKPLGGSKGRPRVDDRQVEACDARHWIERLADVDRTDHYDAWRRQVDVEEVRTSVDLD